MVQTGTFIILIINWLIFGIAGVIFIQRGVKLHKRAIRSDHKITRRTLEVRGNLSITLGIICSIWVIYGVIWFIMQ